MGDKTKEQLLEELAEVQKMLEKRTEAQGKLIRKFQLLIANEDLFSQIIDFFPYPIVIFTPQYTLVMVNKAFATKTKISVKDLEKGVIRILQYKISDTRLAAAVTGVFAGDTFFLEDLKNPFSMFSGIKQQNVPKSENFGKVVIFPVPAENAEITHGVAVFMT
jgi:AraC family transcriptional regulator